MLLCNILFFSAFVSKGLAFLDVLSALYIAVLYSAKLAVVDK